MAGNAVSGELSNHKTAAIFGGEAAARDAATRLRAALGLGDAQVQVVSPRDASPGRKLQPESRGILRTIVRAHLVFGLLGLAAGAVVFAILWGAGIPMIVHNAAMALVTLLGFGLVFGLMLGGLFALRPDQDAYIATVRDALGEGRSAVVVHAFDAAQRDAAAEWLRGASGEVLESL